MLNNSTRNLNRNKAIKKLLVLNLCLVSLWKHKKTLMFCVKCHFFIA